MEACTDPNAKTLTHQDVEKISVGMTKDSVVSLLGEPNCVQVNTDFTKYCYNYDQDVLVNWNMHIYFCSDTVYKFETR